MPRVRHQVATFACLLAIWLQMLAPVLASAMPTAAFDPLASICHSGSGGASPHAGDRDHHEPEHHAPCCDHCLLCHAVLGGLLPDGRPVFTAFDFPVASVLRWTRSTDVSPPAPGRRSAQPRGPPSLV